MGHLVGGAPDLHGVMLHPAGLGEDLPEFLVHNGTDVAGFVEENAAGACGALVQGHDVLHNNASVNQIGFPVGNRKPYKQMFCLFQGDQLDLLGFPLVVLFPGPVEDV